MILIDSTVWSIALRRRHRDRNTAEKAVYFQWRDLVAAGRAAIIGPVRQEVLSGVRYRLQCETLRSQLHVIPMLPLPDSIWDVAADYFNTCQSAGVAAGDIDMMVCAAATAHGCPIFTTDPDFPRYARHLPISLFTG
jgi:predicted nucleic acid-binding protein